LVAKNDFSGKSLYVCGNPDMTTDVKKLALTEWGMDKKDLHVEGYI
jgi:ferredoxin-NADP reductase